MNSSDDMRPISVGKVPLVDVETKSRALSRVSVPISMGIVPVIELALTLKNSMVIEMIHIMGHEIELVGEERLASWVNRKCVSTHQGLARMQPYSKYRLQTCFRTLQMYLSRN
jgi:hypothetical protein